MVFESAHQVQNFGFATICTCRLMSRPWHCGGRCSQPATCCILLRMASYCLLPPIDCCVQLCVLTWWLSHGYWFRTAHCLLFVVYPLSVDCHCGCVPLLLAVCCCCPSSVDCHCYWVRVAHCLLHCLHAMHCRVLTACRRLPHWLYPVTPLGCWRNYWHWCWMARILKTK